MTNPVFYFKGKIVSEKLLFFLDKLYSCNDEDSCIHLFLDSEGGSVPASIAFANFIIESHINLTTYNLGCVDSAAIIVFLSGTTRYCSPNAMFRFHEIRKELTGLRNRNELRAVIHEIDEMEKAMTSFLYKRTNVPVATWKKYMRLNHVVNKSEAAKKRIITTCDEIHDFPHIQNDMIIVDDSSLLPEKAK